MTRRGEQLISPLRRWMKAARITFAELAARCLRLGWKTSGNHLQQVAAGTRGIKWPKAVILSRATGFAVSPQEVVSFRSLKLETNEAHPASRPTTGDTT